MIYGYLRVSSDEQDVNSQKQGVDKFASDKGWVIEKYITDEGVSGGKDPDKRNLGPLLKLLQKGDVIISSEISRLGRDLYMVMDILHFCMERGCIIYTVKDKFVLGDDIQSKVLAFAFGLSAEIERQMIRQRTKRVPLPFALPAIPTLTLPAWAWTCTTATSATDGRPMHKGRRSPERSTSAAWATRWEPRRTRSSLSASTPNGWRSRPGTGTCAPRNGCGTRWPSSGAIRTRRCCRHIYHRKNNLQVPTNLPHDGEALGVCRRMVIKPSGGTGRVHPELKTIY